jgi:glycerol-3-phosphate acyltransferase PlsY
VSILYHAPVVVVAFLIGSVPFGLIVSRTFFHRDIRASGSGNIGAANALRTLGRKAGIAVLVLDALKGVCATILPWLVVVTFLRIVDPSSRTSNELVALVFSGPTHDLPALCGLAAILGHCYSPWLRFRGGKGVATFLGVLFVAGWPSAVAFMITWLAIVLSTGFASLGSMLGAVAAALVLAAMLGPWTFPYSLAAVALIVWKHRENVARLRHGTENKLDLIKTRDEPRAGRSGS